MTIAVLCISRTPKTKIDEPYGLRSAEVRQSALDDGRRVALWPEDKMRWHPAQPVEERQRCDQHVCAHEQEEGGAAQDRVALLGRLWLSRLASLVGARGGE